MLGTPDDRRTLSSASAAAVLGISKATLLRAVHRGWLPPAYRTPGGHLRFRREDLERFQREVLGWDGSQ